MQCDTYFHISRSLVINIISGTTSFMLYSFRAFQHSVKRVKETVRIENFIVYI